MVYSLWPCARCETDSCLQEPQNFEVASNAIKLSDRGPGAAAGYIIGLISTAANLQSLSSTLNALNTHYIVRLPL